MESRYIFLGAVVVIFVAAIVYNTMRSSSYQSRYMLDNTDESESSLRAMFLEASSNKLQEIASCISKNLFTKYTYDQASALITEDNFKNNPDVKKILDSCTLNVLRNLYMIVKASMTNECATKHPRAVINWVLENVEYRVHTPQEVKQILDNLSKELSKICWSDGSTNVIVTFTIPRVQLLVTESMNEQLRNQFLSSTKYSTWIKEVSTRAVYKYRDSGGRSDVYIANLDKMTGADFDSLTDNDFAKISIQAQIANTLLSGWCKGIPELIQALEPLEFKLYTQDEAVKIIDNIYKQWCWDPAMLTGRAQDTLKKTF